MSAALTSAMLWLKGMSKFVLLIVFILFQVVVFGQKTTSYKNEQWVQYYNSFKMSTALMLKSDIGYRVKNNFENPSQYIVRSGLYYKIMPRMQFGLGIAHLGFYDSDHNINIQEYRPYQELLINDKYDKFKAQHRFRAEQRFFSTDVKNYMYHRFRYRFLIKIPLFHNDGSKKLDLNIADEIFIHAGKEAVYNIFNQNRVMIGATYTINKKMALTLTYTSQHQAKNSPGRYDYSNIVWLGIKQKINPTRPREKN